MTILLFAVLILGGSAVASFFISNKQGHLNDFIRGIGGIGALGLTLIPTFQVLLGGETERWHCSWTWGDFILSFDPLSAFFLLPVALLSIAATLYGLKYMRHPHYASRKNLGMFWCNYQLLLLSMIMILLSHTGLVFLLFWELMSLSSFFLLMFENEKKEVRRAGWLYLALTQLGTLCLFAMFFLLEQGDSSRFTVYAQVIFFLSLVGFGTKAGIVPLHGWLPLAHPAAPSFVSALMSGVMIKMGIYGILRTLFWLNGLHGVGPSTSWGVILIALGAVSGILGILFALAQHDIKSLLAYSSIENVGIILLGIGLGVYGQSIDSKTLMVLGFAGGLFHVLNHALFKGLLFLSAGATILQTHTKEIDQMGGLMKKMPFTGFSFFIGALCVCGLPPFNGFISEFIIYMASFWGLLFESKASEFGVIPMLVIILSLTLIGGLALYCFTKAFGIIFLGENRKQDPTVFASIKESSLQLLFPMFALMIICMMIGLLSFFVLPILERPVFILSSHSLMGRSFIGLFTKLSLAFFIFIFLLTFLWMIRLHLLRRRKVETTVTWDCAYIAPYSRIQYSSSSFARPLLEFFQGILITKDHNTLNPHKIFPSEAKFLSRTPDTFMAKIVEPLYKGLSLFHSVVKIQNGKLHFYVFYIVLALIVLLIWGVPS